jgi:hypothetical protein
MIQDAAQGLRQHADLVDIDFPAGLITVMGMIGNGVMAGEDLVKALMVLFKVPNGQPGHHVDGHIDGGIILKKKPGNR